MKPLAATLAIIASLLLPGCQATSFEEPPLAATDCDAALVGHWQSMPEQEGGKPGEVTLRISRDCTLQLREQRKDGSLRRAETRLQVGRSAAQRYAWLPADWDWLQFEPANRGQRSDVFVLRYAIAGDELELWMPDSKAIAHLIIDGRIRGDIDKRGNELVNRITGEPQPEALDLPGVFDGQGARFQRTKDEGAP